MNCQLGFGIHFRTGEYYVASAQGQTRRRTATSIGPGGRRAPARDRALARLRTQVLLLSVDVRLRTSSATTGFNRRQPAARSRLLDSLMGPMVVRNDCAGVARTSG